MRVLNLIYLGAIALSLTLSSCGTWKRIGDLNMISNRNIETSKEYVLVERNASAKARMNKSDALETAIDEITEEFNGEYLMNAKIYIRGSIVKVEGDVYALKKTSNNTNNLNNTSNFNVGETVEIKIKNKKIKGKIIEIKNDHAIITYHSTWDGDKSEPFQFSDIYKIEK